MCRPVRPVPSGDGGDGVAQAAASRETLPIATHQDDGPLEFQALQGLPGLEQLAVEWLALAESLPAMRFMHLPQWYRAYLVARKSDPDQIWFVAARRGSRLIAVFPLQFQNYHLRSLHPRLLGTIDDGELQLSDFVFAQTADNRDLLHELARWLRSQHLLCWDELRLRKVP